ncbi:DUF3667 domain-containing protein [Daejeonella lutea]|uniref:DUF3667 domain-containing protein n=1 Tax=Daejeonella lutea TaxID=572036 RepID=A0A1T5BNY2_9SPHI|nr:DUF3667 domain-containing protein [Daejeonella lutea]SKB49032.1 Protein of unknown function [Daejeonella lutea]
MGNCKNCGNGLAGKYCHVCGQKNIIPEERTLGHLAHEFVHFFTHLDGKFVKTLKTIFTHPGLVTLHVKEGITQRYFKLSSLFVIITLVYFLIPNTFTISNNMVTTYQTEVSGGGVSKWKKEIALNKSRRVHLSETALARRYNEKKHNYGKLATLLFLPLTIPVLWGVQKLLKFHKDKKLSPYDMGIASLELNSLIVAGFYIIVGLITQAILAIFKSETAIIAMVVISLLAICCYILFFFKRVYNLNLWKSTLSMVLFCSGYIVAMILYGIITFVIFI